PKDVRQPPRRDAEGVASAGVGIDAVKVAGAEGKAGIVAGADADEDTGLAAGKLIGRHASALERLPAQLQQQPLLRIHANGLAGADTEEAGVEAVDCVDKAACAGVALAGCIGVRVVKGVHIPALSWYLADGVDPVAQQAPEGLGVVSAAREA